MTEKTLEFPVQIAKVMDWIPHRPPMVWVDSVLWVNSEAGECLVLRDPLSHACEPKGKIRNSTPLEWIAQTIGYVDAVQVRLGFKKGRPVSQALVVGLRNFQLRAPLNSPGLKSFKIYCRVIREWQGLGIVDAQVKDAQTHQVLATAQLKIFSN